MTRRSYTIMKWGWLSMPKISTRVTFDKKAAIAKIRAAGNDALTIAGQQALKDVTKYVPRDQGFLQDSGITNSDDRAEDMTYTLRWDEPYAQYLWHGELMHGNPVNRTYGPEKLKFTSALARIEWAKYAQKVYGANWEKVYQAALRREMSK